MRARFSKWGVYVAISYIAFVALLLVSVQNCRGDFCSAGILLAVLPWFPFFDEVNLPVNGMTLFWMLVVLDILILYFLFAAVERWVKKGK